jgi:glycosyltransferase involved in cell wall biosynthesis
VIRRRRIGIVSETFRPDVNGVAATLGHLVDGLRRRGHEVSVLCPRPHRPGATRAEPGVTVMPSLALPGAAIRFGLPALARVADAWGEAPPEVVYVATEGPLGWAAERVARHGSIPVVSGFHTNFDVYAAHYRLGALQPLIRGYLRRFHNRTSATIVPTPALRDELQAAGFRNLSVLGRGIDTSRFTPDRRSAALRESWGVAATDLVALYVGRVAPEKNIGVAVDAWRAMRAAAPSTRLVVVGDGPLRESLQRAHPDVVFAGVRLGDDLASYYASADVFLFPSETETFGNVTLEAMASGLAVVAYDYAAARMHVTDSQTGLLAPLGDAGNFVQAATRLARCTGTAAVLGRRAREAVAESEWSRIVERFEALLLREGERGERLAGDRWRCGSAHRTARGA